ncbi:MAG: Ldh family oxidoreductase [Nitrospirae bacterium]|nr:Ldh family oxidoreductase [Nitrospirota bacterium]
MLVRDTEGLREFVAAIFCRSGAAESTARIVAESLVEANLAGHDSHGIIRVTEYLRQIGTGELKPSAVPTLVREGPAAILVDGGWGFGQVVARWVTDRLIEKASNVEVAVAGVFHCGHVGCAGTYPALAAARGCLALALVNGGGAQARVAPFGGVRPVFGTNPFAAAVPVEGAKPLVMDFSTAVVASGRIRLAREQGEMLPEGWILDRLGRPSRRPEDYYDGGMLLPFGGHKGYALCLLVEILAGLLTGAGSLAVQGENYEIGNGLFMAVLNPNAFQNPAGFAAQVRVLCECVKSSAPADGRGEVLLPGELEERTKARRLREGIPVSDAVWKSVLEAGQLLGVRWNESWSHQASAVA